MKSIKVFWNGKRLKDIYPHATRFQVIKYRIAKFLALFVKASLVTAFVVGVVWGGFETGKAVTRSTVVYAVKEGGISPVLGRIAKAESMNSHYCTEELINRKLCAKSELGQVLLNGNKDGSVDIGKYQINNYHWGADATKLGLNLFDEEDNEKMAVWIYENYGTEPWSASKHNWK